MQCWSLVIDWYCLHITIILSVCFPILYLQLPTWHLSAERVASVSYYGLLTCPFRWMSSDLYRPECGPFRVHVRLKIEDRPHVCVAVKEWWPHELSRFSQQKPPCVCIVTWKDGVRFLRSWCCDHTHCVWWIKAGTVAWIRNTRRR
jgi:hypothetical protein